MRHLKSGRGLGVDPSHRIALLRSLTLALIEKETIRTTRARAKELRWYAERMVTLAKRGDVAARRHMVKLLGSTETQHAGENRVRNAIARVYSELVPRFKTRPGGYTQIFHTVDRRPGDNAEMCIMRYIPSEDDAKSKKKTDKKAEAKSDKGAKTEAKDSKKAKAEASSDHKHDKKHADKGPEDKPAKAKKKTEK
jgi:large subunit ribosomal protein L17